MNWYYINLSYATFGVAEEDGKVITTPPIAKWMCGKSIEHVTNWVLSKHGEIIKLRNYGRN